MFYRVLGEPYTAKGSPRLLAIMGLGGPRITSNFGPGGPISRGAPYRAYTGFLNCSKSGAFDQWRRKGYLIGWAKN